MPFGESRPCAGLEWAAYAGVGADVNGCLRLDGGIEHRAVDRADDAKLGASVALVLLLGAGYVFVAVIGGIVFAVANVAELVAVDAVADEVFYDFACAFA